MRLLLAEDEKDLSDGLVAILRKNKYSVDAVYNGRDAIDYLEADNYDGAILDIMMPLVDGIEVLKTVRKNGNQIPILMLTAKSEINDRVVGLDNGADDYLTKPFSSKELLARIRAMTRRKTEGKAENLITFGNLTLDKVNYEMFTEEGRESVGNKEFQIIEMLMMNKGQYISAERFFEKIWGYESEADIAVIWVNISNLRKRLKKLNADVEIKAKRDIGYRIEAIS
ncbi:MAG: response regulator transcription factor [Bacilli bacterium]